MVKVTADFSIGDVGLSYTAEGEDAKDVLWDFIQQRQKKLTGISCSAQLCYLLHNDMKQKERRGLWKNANGATLNLGCTSNSPRATAFRF